MRFATLDLDGKAVPAIVSPDGNGYATASDWLGTAFDGGMPELIALRLQPTAQPAPTAWQPLGERRLRAPLVPRRNVFCVGKNYHEHAAEFARSGFDTSAAKGETAPAAPVVFTKAPSTVVGPGDEVLAFGELTRQLDYEAELAVVIGKPGRGIRAEDAWNHVWGYTIVNDVTARDLQQKHRQWFIGKSLDTFCPMGPWIVTADELDATDLSVKCWINDELRQNANTRDLIFDIPTIIATLSAGMTLQPGDVIATGTPAGVGIGFTPPRFLVPGDRMKIEIGGIGTLENRIAG